MKIKPAIEETNHANLQASVCLNKLLVLFEQVFLHLSEKEFSEYVLSFLSWQYIPVPYSDTANKYKIVREKGRADSRYDTFQSAIATVIRELSCEKRS